MDWADTFVSSVDVCISLAKIRCRRFDDSSLVFFSVRCVHDACCSLSIVLFCFVVLCAVSAPSIPSNERSKAEGTRKIRRTYRLIRLWRGCFIVFKASSFSPDNATSGKYERGLPRVGGDESRMQWHGRPFYLRGIVLFTVYVLLLFPLIFRSLCVRFFPLRAASAAAADCCVCVFVIRYSFHD